MDVNRIRLWRYRTGEVSTLTEEWRDALEMLVLSVEEYYEANLTKARVNPGGPIFALKNLGWTDRVEVQSTQQSPSVVINISMANQQALPGSSGLVVDLGPALITEKEPANGVQAPGPEAPPLLNGQ